MSSGLPSPSSSPAAPPALDPLVRRELLEALALDDGAQGRELAGLLHARIPELGSVREQRVMVSQTRDCCATHVGELLGLLESGRTLEGVSTPDCGREYAVGFVRRRIPLTALMRSYRIAQHHLWETFARRLRTVEDPAAGQGLQVATALLFEYVDLVARDVAEVYVEERDGRVRTAAAVRSETARELLAGARPDVDVASRRLGYELRGSHTALIVSADPARDGVTSAGLERAVHSAAAGLGGGEPLVVPVSGTTIWAWVPTGGADDESVDRAVGRLRPAPGLRLAAGRPGAGVEGFCVSHQEARHAAELHDERPGSRASYRALELVSLLAADPARARRFVARELGPLAHDDETAAGLRETALAFLDHGGSHVGAAAVLHVHKNTVYSRIRRAEAELGRPIGPGRVALHAALTLAVTVPGRVLAPASPPPG